MRLKDNNVYLKDEFEKRYPKLSSKLVDKTLIVLLKEENFLVFPSDFTASDDLKGASKIIETVNDCIKTHNVIGFIGCGDERLEIHSRFSGEGNDYFLHYMLQKILNLNVVDLDTKLSMEEQLYHLLLYLFPRYLNAAMRKGLFKQYKRFEYSDTNINGSINIARHIKTNTPFTGKIAYSTRELTQDNPLMHLVRHTIEFIRLSTQNGYMLLNSSELTRQNVIAVIQMTPSYNPCEKRNIIAENQTTPVRHAYYTEYRALQRLCLMILSHRRHNLGGDSKNIHGILFDVAWLWEEYLNTMLEGDFVHPRNKQGKDGISLFSDRTRTAFPDFYNRSCGVIVDAKYKKLELTAKGIAREDLYQIITYAYILEAKRAGVVFPSLGDTEYSQVGSLAGYGAEIFKHSIHIPGNANTYNEFVLAVRKSEDKFKQRIKSLLYEEVEE